MSAKKNLGPRAILYIIALVLSGLLIIVLFIFSVTMVVLCGLDNPYTYGSCLAQSLGFSATVAIILIASGIVARKYPFISGAALIAIGMVPLVLIVLEPDVSSLFVLSIPFFVVGLLFLSMGCFDQVTEKKTAISGPQAQG